MNAIDTQVLLLLLSVFCLMYLTARKVTQFQKNQHLPPGPRPKPLIGNLFDFPVKDAEKEYVKWASKYNSNVLFASALGSHVLVLNKLEDAVELLEKRSYKYSYRPSIPVANLMAWDRNMALMPYGNFWRKHKKICQQQFRQEASSTYNPIQLEKVKMLLRNLLEHPEEFGDHSKLLAVGIPLASVYGYGVDTLNDPCVEVADESALVGASLLLPGTCLINVFPFLRHVPAWIPGAASQKIAAKVKELTLESIRVPIDNLRDRMEKGPVSPSLVSTFLDGKSSSTKRPEGLEIIENIAYTVYAAASDTTLSASSSLFYLMATHPEIQKKAQKEIDRFVGSSHLPTFEDRKQLPYVEAIYREMLRFQPPVPICLPHVLTEDDYYKGYLIPKGTTVLANICEAVYEKPFEFIPERFLKGNGELNDDGRILAYGFGRRICVGKHVASSTLWILVASILAAFNIERAQDEDGNDIAISDDYGTNGIIVHKLPFKCTFKPRSERVRDLIMD